MAGEALSALVLGAGDKAAAMSIRVPNSTVTPDPSAAAAATVEATIHNAMITRTTTAVILPILHSTTRPLEVLEHAIASLTL